MTRSVRYQPVPSGLLIECELPDPPRNNGELSEAFLVAYECAERGNEDKRAIKSL